MSRPTILPTRRGASRLAAVTLAGFALTGCGADTEPRETAEAGRRSATPVPSPATTPAPSTSGSRTPDAAASPVDPDAVTIELTVRGDDIEPGPARVKVRVGKPVVFRIDSDRPGGLHVHSSPEQTPEFEVGRSTITLTLDRPGVVEVEEHEADALVAQLEVR